MLILCKRKDGGKDSSVDAYILLEIKRYFSIVLLKFNKGGREVFHTHAFDALTWFISGEMVEEDVSGELYIYTRSIRPKLTLRAKNHRVIAIVDSLCFSIRGPWSPTWSEYTRDTDTTTVLAAHRRKERSYKGL